MGSDTKSLNFNHNSHDHGVHHELRYHTPTKLSLLVPSRSTMPAEAPTPPPRTATVSVPFQWEEAPGKPRPCHTRSEPINKGSDVARTLDLPPRLLLSMPSPTTVLDGPYVGRATSFTSSYRTPRENWNSNFGSSRWSGMTKKNNDGEEYPEGSFDFSSWTEDGYNKVKITSVRKRGSFSRLSQARSQLWAGIYERFKQVVPWRRRQERQRKLAPKIDTA